MSRYYYVASDGYPQRFPEYIHDILKVITLLNGTSTTNSELIRLSRTKIAAKEMGAIIAKLREYKFIDYQHIETGRQARGSGRYVVVPTFRRPPEPTEES